MRVSLRLAVLMRLTSAVVGSFVAVLGSAPPARPSWVILAAAFLLLWALAFTYVALTRGLSGRLVVADIIVVAIICLAQSYLLPATALQVLAGTGWVDVVASIGVLGAQMGLRLGPGTLVSGLVAAAYAIGRSSVTEMPVVLVLQGVMAGCIMTLLRRAARDADRTLEARTQADVVASSQEAVRADERDQQRRLHDTVLATLTMVGTGTITRRSPALIGRVTADLAVLNRLRDPPENADGSARTGLPEARTARLDLVLNEVSATPQPGLPQLDMRLDVPPIELPHHVMTAIAGSVVEALTNIARHADTTSVLVRARHHRDGVTLDVGDSGRGFDVDRIPPERRGWRDSIAGRMREIDGSARIVSTEGEGTIVTLRWPA